MCNWTRAAHFLFDSPQQLGIATGTFECYTPPALLVFLFRLSYETVGGRRISLRVRSFKQMIWWKSVPGALFHLFAGNLMTLSMFGECLGLPLWFVGMHDVSPTSSLGPFFHFSFRV